MVFLQLGQLECNEMDRKVYYADFGLLDQKHMKKADLFVYLCIEPSNRDLGLPFLTQSKNHTQPARTRPDQTVSGSIPPISSRIIQLECSWAQFGLKLRIKSI